MHPLLRVRFVLDLSQTELRCHRDSQLGLMKTKKQKDFAFVVVIYGGEVSMEVGEHQLDW